MNSDESSWQLVNQLIDESTDCCSSASHRGDRVRHDGAAFHICAAHVSAASFRIKQTSVGCSLQ